MARLLAVVMSILIAVVASALGYTVTLDPLAGTLVHPPPSQPGGDWSTNGTAMEDFLSSSGWTGLWGNVTVAPTTSNATQPPPSTGCRPVTLHCRPG